MKKRILNCVLTTLIVGQLSSVTAFANQLETKTPEKNNIKIEKINQNSLSIKDFDTEEIIKVNESNGIRKITITNLKTNKIDYIIYNSNNNTVYSSITNKTIDLNENQDLNPNENIITPRSVDSYETKYISYAQIKSIVGNTANTATVIAAILYFVPGAQGIGGAVGAISTIVGTINGNINASNSHGIRLKIKTTKYYRTRLGRRQVYKISRSINSFGFY